MTRQTTAGGCRRLTLLLSVVIAVCVGVAIGALVGVLRLLLRPALAALHRRLGRLLAVAVLSLLLAACHPPRTAAHLSGAFTGEQAVDDAVHLRLACAVLPAGLLCQAAGDSPLLEGLWWRVLDARGAMLAWAHGCRDVAISLPEGAARLEVLLPATVAGRRVWRLAWSREVQATP